MKESSITVTVKNISKGKQRVPLFPGQPKEDVEKGAEFEADPKIAKDLARMYPKSFKILGENITQGEGATDEEVEAEKEKVAQGIYDQVASAILPTIMAKIADDEVAQEVLDGLNTVFAEYDEEVFKPFSLTVDQELVVTDEDIKNNPELPKDVKVGDKVVIQVPAFDRPIEEVEDTEQEDDGEKSTPDSEGEKK